MYPEGGRELVRLRCEVQVLDSLPKRWGEVSTVKQIDLMKTIAGYPAVNYSWALEELETASDA